MKRIPIIFLAVIAFSCGRTAGPDAALSSIDEEGLKARISVLASDDFQGRAPSTVGEEKTVNYLTEQFEALGLQPGNGDSWFQEVPLVQCESDPSMVMKIDGKGGAKTLKFSDEFVGGTSQTKEKIEVRDAEMVFVGYGINAPEAGWNDYEGLDVKGKAVVMLVNDPGFATGDSSLFTGKAMTYYGRWTYKYEEAARQGAAAAIIIHETEPASYGWGVVQNSWTGPQYYLEDNEIGRSPLQLQSWITRESAVKLFADAGLDFEKIKSAAAKKGFKPVDLGQKVTVEFENKVTRSVSRNVVAVLPGTDLNDEYIIYTAHWDHFGINSALEGDSILNGARDNATGTAAVIEIAEAFTKLGKAQRRSIIFMPVTCEEQGLLGSEYYATHPLFPLNKTVGVINMDALNIFGATRDMTIVGYGNSELDKYAEEVLAGQDRYVRPDPTPEKGSYFRSDHFNFAKVGVPALYLGGGVDNVEHGVEWGLKASEDWSKANYHKPSDNYEPDVWVFDGMVQDVKTYFEIGYNLSMIDDFPAWSDGVSFKNARDKMMGK